MTDLTIEREVVIDAPVDVVWRTITEPDQIEQWFANRVELEGRPGGRGRLVFEDRATEKPAALDLVVEVADPPSAFSFRWGHPAGETPVPGNSVLVAFTLSPERDDRTRLRVVETGLELLSWSSADKAQYAEEHRNGWTVHLGRLVEVLAGRHGDESAR